MFSDLPFYFGKKVYFRYNNTGAHCTRLRFEHSLVFFPLAKACGAVWECQGSILVEQHTLGVEGLMLATSVIEVGFQIRRDARLTVKHITD